jgi:hypothetical protein
MRFTYMAINRNGNTSEESALTVMQTAVMETQRNMIAGWDTGQVLGILSARDEDDEEDDDEDGSDIDELS